MNTTGVCLNCTSALIAAANGRMAVAVLAIGLALFFLLKQASVE